MNSGKTLACAEGVDLSPDRAPPDGCLSAFPAVPQHFVCPIELCDGESGKHPPLQFVASADSDLRAPPAFTLLAIHRIFVPTSHGLQESMSLKKGNHSEI